MGVPGISFVSRLSPSCPARLALSAPALVPVETQVHCIR